MIDQPLSFTCDLWLTIGKVEASTSIEPYESLMVVYPSGYVGVLSLKLYQFPSPSTPGVIRDQILIEIIVDVGVHQ